MTATAIGTDRVRVMVDEGHEPLAYMVLGHHEPADAFDAIRRYCTEVEYDAGWLEEDTLPATDGKA